SGAVPVSRLSDRARIDEVAPIRLEWVANAIPFDDLDANAVGLEREDAGNVAVPEETDRKIEEPEVHERVAIGKDIRVLVAGRPVADRESRLDLERPERQRLQKLATARRELRRGPAGGRQGDGIEEIPGVGAADDLVVVAPDRGGLAPQSPNALDDLVGVG